MNNSFYNGVTDRKVGLLEAGLLQRVLILVLQFSLPTASFNCNAVISIMTPLLLLLRSSLNLRL